MSYTLLHPALIASFSGFTALSDRLVNAVMFITNAIGVDITRDHSRAVPLNALALRLRRMMVRLNALMIRFKAGHAMQRAAASRPAARKPRAARAPGYRLPTTSGWLHQIAPGARQFTAFVGELPLQDADLCALAEASPQARRLLRPLWRMLGLTPPEAFRPRPAKAAPPEIQVPPPVQARPDRPPPRPPAPDG